jgi:hypothetical protein
MQLEVEAAREAIQAGIATRRQAWQPDGDDRPAARWMRERQWEHAAVDELVDSLSDDYGAEATLGELRKGKEDPFIAAAIFEICSLNRRPLREFFSRDEIVDAALTYLTSEGWTSGLGRGGWAWDALFQHDVGSEDHFDDEEHFGLLLDVLARAPMDDAVLFPIGDGPLSHAAAAPTRYAEIQKLAETDPKIARAWWLNVTDDGRLDVD